VTEVETAAPPTHLTIDRHGTTLRFDTTAFPDELPYVYGPLRKGKVYEEPFLEHIRGLGRRGEYVDVGAHLGTHTVWFAALCPATHVHAFEPVERYAHVAERNVEANGLSDRVTVYRLGLAALAGRARNHLSREHQVGFESTAHDVDEEFDVVRLDDVVSGPVAILKLDVEGMEPAVLRGSTRILERSHPVVFAECHSPEIATDIARQLEPFGYRPTGRVFNSSPTYEYAVPPRVRSDRLRRLYRRLPIGFRSAVRRLITARRA
jgi:FkbM family methyltransferase